LLALGKAGYRLHYLTLANGSCGSTLAGAARVSRIRAAEAQRAANCLGAEFHPSMVDDLQIFYELKLLRKLAAVIREVNPRIVLTHSPQDYMEDHMNTARLAVTAAFARPMPNFRTTPTRPAVSQDVTVYHALPHGLRDSLRRRIVPAAYVNTTSVHAIKRQALAKHASQKEWLDRSQGMDSYLHAMDEFSLAVGRMSKRFQHAEGWRRHLHLGFSSTDVDPLQHILGEDYLVNREYEQDLEGD
jgi:LmbE family N-acetylglucosaminyl deacetylase